MAKISVYINEKASKTNADHWKKELHKHLFRHEVHYLVPKNLKDLENSLFGDIKNQTEYIFSIGGDGTANIITQYIALTGIKLMIIPCGTANDFASELGISQNIKKIIKVFQHRSSRKIDLIKVNNQYMFSNGGIGLASDVALKINQYRKKHSSFKKLMKKIGANTYSLILGKELFLRSLRFYRIKITSPDSPLSNSIVKTAMILINNQTVIGGKFPIAPETSNSDGLYNVSLFLHDNKKDLFATILKIMFSRKNISDEKLVTFETNQLVIQNMENENLNFFGDGEILGQAKKFEIGIIRKGIEVCSYQNHIMYSNSYSLEDVSLV